MHTLTATYRIVTPMFLGDANQNATEIRPPSVKGALRFWWRALNWGRFRNGSDDATALRNLHEAEAELFGAAADEDNRSKSVLGQSKFILQINYKKTQDILLEPIKPGIQYLLGQGLCKYDTEKRCVILTRSYLNPGELSVRLMLNSRVTEQQCHELKQALIVLGLLGSLGSRARHGFGCLVIEKIEEQLTGNDSIAQVDYPKSLKEIQYFFDIKNSSELPPFTAFSKLSRLDLSVQGNDCLALLDQIGREMVRYRSFGRKPQGSKEHLVLGEAALQIFKPDHDQIFDFINDKNKKPDALPKRAVFGLPHNYFFSSTQPSKGVDITAAQDGRSRRASPLFLHIHRFGDGTYAAFQLFLPSIFLNPGDLVKLEAYERRGGRKIILHKGLIQMVNKNSNWVDIHKYLDRFAERNEVIHGIR